MKYSVGEVTKAIEVLLEQVEENEKLKEENKILKDAIEKCASLDCNSYLAQKVLEKITNTENQGGNDILQRKNERNYFS